jgi:hypothetical protein
MPTPSQSHRVNPRAVLITALVFAPLLTPPVRAAETVSASTNQAADEVLAWLGGDDADLRAVALDAIRNRLKGEWFTRRVADALPGLPASRQSALLAALADRGDAAALPAATKTAAAATDAGVRAAAVSLIGRLGGPADVPTLVAALAAGGPQQDAARRGLVEIAGADAAAAIRAAATSGAPATRAVVIDALAERRDRAALPVLDQAAIDDDPAVRGAAMRALARFGGPAEIPAMVQSLLKASGEEERAAQLAITAVCTGPEDAGRATDALVTRYQAADDPARARLLPALARVGGPQVMAIVDAMLADPARRPQGLDALSKWPDATVKDRLLDLLAKATDPKEKQLLLGTLIRIAPLPDNKLNDAAKLDLLVKTMALCERTEDKARVLERANAIRTIETFRFVAPYLDDPALAEPACRSVVELAHHQKLRDAHKAEFTAALDKVLGITKNEELVERATRYKAGQTWDRKKKP